MEVRKVRVEKVCGNERRESKEEEENCWRKSRGNNRREIEGNWGSRGCISRVIKRK